MKLWGLSKHNQFEEEVLRKIIGNAHSVNCYDVLSEMTYWTIKLTAFSMY